MPLGNGNLGRRVAPLSVQYAESYVCVCVKPRSKGLTYLTLFLLYFALSVQLQGAWRPFNLSMAKAVQYVVSAFRLAAVKG